MSIVRMLAAEVLAQVVTQGVSLTEALDVASPTLADSRDRAFLQAVCFGACRFYPRFNFILSQLLEKPLPAKESVLGALLMIGFYQLDAMRVPAHAAVAETVNATLKLDKPWARGLVNAILRRYLRERETMQHQIAENKEAYYAHPEWLLTALKKDYPSQWEKIALANNEKPPMVLRVNTRHISREDYLTKLEAMDIAATAVNSTNSGVVIETPMMVESLPGFYEGEVSVQDGAAQWAADLLTLPTTPCRVLDACAAPGGKLTQLLQCVPQDSTVVAIEKQLERMAAIHDNLKRLQLSATCFCADAMDTAAWWDGQSFDRILLDAPCSGSGVIRRHPDIKLLRRPTDLPVLAEQQLSLLRVLWPLLAPGGILLYATCSIFPEENENVMRSFVQDHPDAASDKIEAVWGVAQTYGRQMLPGGYFDGFYYARLKKE